jgi:hypothetical protein
LTGHRSIIRERWPRRATLLRLVACRIPRRIARLGSHPEHEPAARDERPGEEDDQRDRRVTPVRRVEAFLARGRAADPCP